VTEPRSFIQAYIDHRMAREAQILEQIRAGRHRVRDMVSAMYADVDKRLHPAAAHSVLAHLIHMVETGRVRCDGKPDLEADYRLGETGA